VRVSPKRSTGPRRCRRCADHLDEELVTETLGCVVGRRRRRRLKRELAAGGIGRFVAAQS
jgi:hypothetical protein